MWLSWRRCPSKLSPSSLFCNSLVWLPSMWSPPGLGCVHLMPLACIFCLLTSQNLPSNQSVSAVKPVRICLLTSHNLPINTASAPCCKPGGYLSAHVVHFVAFSILSGGPIALPSHCGFMVHAIALSTDVMFVQSMHS